MGELARKLSGRLLPPRGIGNLPGDRGHQPLRCKGDTPDSARRKAKPALAIRVFLAAPGADHAIEINQQCSGYSHGRNLAGMGNQDAPIAVAEDFT